MPRRKTTSKHRWRRNVTPLRVYAVGSAVVLLLCAETLLGQKAHAAPHILAAQGASIFPPWWADPETLKGWAALLTAGTMFVGAFFSGSVRLVQVVRGVPVPPFPGDPTASGS